MKKRDSAALSSLGWGGRILLVGFAGGVQQIPRIAAADMSGDPSAAPEMAEIVIHALLKSDTYSKPAGLLLSSPCDIAHLKSRDHLRQELPERGSAVGLAVAGYAKGPIRVILKGRGRSTPSTS